MSSEGEKRRKSVRCRNDQLCTSKATIARICEESFSLVGYFPLTVSTALRALAEDLLKAICTAVLCSKLYSMVEINDYEWSTKLEVRDQV